MRTRFLACALIAALTGLSQTATAASPPTSARKAPPSGLSDATIEQTIRMKLAKSKIGADGFTVRVQGGVAYWQGKTDVLQHKGAATRMAKTAGAVRVVNNIQISEAARRRAAHNLNGGAGGGTVPRATVKRSDTSPPPAR